MTEPDLDQQPNMLSTKRRKIFELLGPAINKDKNSPQPRLGRLSLPGRHAVDTPNCTSVTSRGVIPHITPDNFKKHIASTSAYMALEDFIERNPPPIYSIPTSASTTTPTKGQKLSNRALHAFTALPSSQLTILGPRRCPAVPSPVGNKHSSIAIFTSTGFYDLAVAQYVEAAKALGPDIVVSPADIPYTARDGNGKPTPVHKKLVRMVDRTDEWLTKFVAAVQPQQQTENASTAAAGGENPESGMAVFAPILPVEHSFQWEYLVSLTDVEERPVDGLAIYDVNIMPDLNSHSLLAELPKLSFDPPDTPQAILRQVALGVDICAVPFVNSTSDAGVALDFTFPPPPPPSPKQSVQLESQSVRPLGHDMWSDSNQISLTPLAETCKCYACTSHHRAYVHHLLNAKEMLGWNLLQIHNHLILSEFFAGIRETLRIGGADACEEAMNRFIAAYASELPVGTGARPRARGYHFKSELGQDKINPSSWKNMNGGEKREGKEKEQISLVAGEAEDQSIGLANQEGGQVTPS